MVYNHFCEQVQHAEDMGASADVLRELLSKGRSKRGIFEGDMVEGQLEIGQIASMVTKEESVKDIFEDLCR
jgi:enoyl-[acyl-carrier protein] reductase II